jgi:hypothetical protein
VDAERHRFWLDGLGHVLKGDACESTEDGCGRASATGWRGYCCEQVRWVEAGSCMELRSPQRRSLVARGSSRATTMIKAAFPVVNAATPTQLCRDLVPQAGSRSQLEAGELFASTWGGRFSQPSSVGGADTDHHSYCSTTHASLAGTASVLVGIAIGGGVGRLSPSPRDCDQKGLADEHCEL